MTYETLIMNIRRVEEPLDSETEYDYYFIAEIVKGGEIKQSGIDCGSSQLTEWERNRMISRLYDFTDQAISTIEDNSAQSGFSLYDSLKEIGFDVYDRILSDQAKILIEQVNPKFLLIRSGEYDIPWELLNDGSDFFCLKFNMGRLPLVSVVSHLAKPKQLDVSETSCALLANPTKDLKDAENEVDAVGGFLESKLNIDVKRFRKDQVDRELFSFEVLRSGKYQLIHYAGHGGFDRKWGFFQLNDGRFYSFQARLLRGNPLIFANACFSARTKMRYAGKIVSGMAPHFIERGCLGYIGALWPIYDNDARDFAITFYQEFLSGMPLGAAIKKARVKLLNKNGNAPTWASYVLFGDPRQNLYIAKKIQPPIEPRRFATTIVNRYGVVREIGRGSYGKVLQVFDKSLGRTLVMKKFYPEVTEDPDFIGWFADFSAFSRNLMHAHIIRVYDIGKDYIVMEYIEGARSLRDVLEKRPLEIGLAFLVTSDVLDALIYLHNKGILHLDVKPSNILITPQMRAKLSDFGLSGTLTKQTQKTRIFNPVYSAPEQLVGAKCTENSDIYSLGVVLREMLTGSPSGDLSVLKGKIPDHRLLELDELLQRMLDQDQYSRPNEIELRRFFDATRDMIMN